MKPTKKVKSPRRPPRRAGGPAVEAEAEVVSGLGPFARDELRARFGKRVFLHPETDPAAVRFRYLGQQGDLRALLQLQQVMAVYLVQHFPVPRPRALLGHQNLQRLLAQIETVRGLHPPAAFRTFRFSAAGQRSGVFTRLKDEIRGQTGLDYDDDEADLLLRVRPAAREGGGWEVLARLSPRPLSARAWRVCDLPGALNSTIARAMVALTRPEPRDRYLNLMCGSGTLLVERLLWGPVRQAAGCDTDVEALRCAGQNLAAAGVERAAQLIQGDAARLDLPAGSFDVLVADLPWGQLVGSHQQNLELYPQVFREAARLAAPQARLVLLSHEIRLMERLLADFGHLWALRQEIRVWQGGLHPRIYAFRRAEGEGPSRRP